MKKTQNEELKAEAGFIIPDEVADRFTDIATAGTVARRLGATVLHMETDRMTIARLEALPTAYWRDEDSAITEGK